MGAYRWVGILFALGGTVAFAFRPVLIKLGYEAAPVSATTLLFLRMALAFPFFAAVAWWLRREPALARRDWAGIVALGFLGYYLASLLDFLGLQYVPAGLGRLIMFLYPTLVVILSALFLARRPTGRELSALAVTYAGIALVLSQRLGTGPEHRLFLLGAALVFGSAMCYAVYLVTGSQLVKRVGSMRFSASATRNTGSTVHAVASRITYHHRVAGSSSAETGSSAKNCTTAGAVETIIV